MKPRHFVTTNLVGGLGNQLFLVFNLLATAHRNGLTPFLPREEWSSSCDAPRPTYWRSVFQHLNGTPVDSPMLDWSNRIPLVLGQLPPYPAPPYSSSKASETVAGDHSDAYHHVQIREPRPVEPIMLSPLSPTQSYVYHLVGFFQSDRFFSDYPHCHAVIPPSLDQAAQNWLYSHYGYLKRSPGFSNSTGELRRHHLVGIHLRRGDYVKMRDVFCYLSLDSYYKKAIYQLLGRLASPSSSADVPSIHLLVFCEDVEEAGEMMAFLRAEFPSLRVTHAHHSQEGAFLVPPKPTHPSTEPQLGHAAEKASEGSSEGTLRVSSIAETCPREVLELLMLSHCDDIIMANSTFSWWSAYLGGLRERQKQQNKLQRVVAPSSWFTTQHFSEYSHLYVDGWLLL